MEKLIVEVNNILCEVIATYHDDTTNKDFIIYTDYTFNENKELNIYYGLYTKQNEKIKVYDIEEEKDRKTALEIINAIKNINK